jgi:hypothetical protein
MGRGTLALAALTLLAGCRNGHTAGDPEHAPAGARTSSPYTSGSDSGARQQQIEGTGTGVEYEAPRRIPGVVAALGQLTGPGKTPSRENLTALRGELGDLGSAMAKDLSRVGLADSGAFHALRDSISRQLGGGPGGLADSLDAAGTRKLAAQVRSLIDIYHSWMRSAQH